ncbi:heat-inducible transcription repressor HrcA [Alkaliphilus pronyensis]|uniref:Heat-inducible transcription repressor HrcA n=1 Tax=Alkaliphilus pronyensis TaxID=1482732 RepID=A0A6I0F8N6_9FIRM|nr:heat-inducible transcriptional repressor HrcA [Alkaliphilus pronyensis]KAB3539090.1 heat-inducible transcription repressor HrcA [Alkaliphilus pronyensis]
MELNDRKLKILQAIIQDYIQTAEPIGSRTLTKRYDLGVSPATIRNEMADLEELGFLMQPHTSAGRVPSDKAYRLYVDALMTKTKNTNYQKTFIKANLLKKFVEVERLLQYSSKVLSELTRYTSLALTPQIKGNKLKFLQLVPIDSENLVAIIVTDTGVIKKPLLKITGGFDEASIQKVSNLLNEKLAGLSIMDIESQLIQELNNEIYKCNNIIEKVVPELFQTLERLDDFELFLNGTTNIFNFPEFSDIFKAKSFLSMLEEKEVIKNLVSTSDNEGITISIGNENCYSEVKEYSLVTATFKISGSSIGWLSVIGPTRMDYANVINIMGQISKHINQLLKKGNE